MSKNNTETKAESIGFRARPSMVARIMAVARKEKRSKSQIVEMCVEEFLSTLEEKHGLPEEPMNLRALSEASSEQAVNPEVVRTVDASDRKRRRPKNQPN